MRDSRRLALELARLIVDAERLTPAGQLNALGVAFVFVLILGIGVFDLIQAIVRIWEPRYTNGLPNLLGLLGVFAFLFLFSVLIVVRLEPPRGRR